MLFPQKTVVVFLCAKISKRSACVGQVLENIIEMVDLGCGQVQKALQEHYRITDAFPMRPRQQEQ